MNRRASLLFPERFALINPTTLETLFGEPLIQSAISAVQARAAAIERKKYLISQGDAESLGCCLRLKNPDGLSAFPSEILTTDRSVFLATSFDRG